MRDGEGPYIPHAMTGGNAQGKQAGGGKMTEKARKLLAQLQDPKRRAKVMDEFNRDNPPSGPSSSNQGMTILKDINEFEDDHDKFMDSLKGVET